MKKWLARVGTAMLFGFGTGFADGFFGSLLGPNGGDDGDGTSACIWIPTEGVGLGEMGS